MGALLNSTGKSTPGRGLRGRWLRALGHGAIALVLLNLIVGALLPAPVLAGLGGPDSVLCLSSGSTGFADSGTETPAPAAPHDHLCALCLPLTGGPALAPDGRFALLPPQAVVLAERPEAYADAPPAARADKARPPRGPPVLS